MPTSYEAAAEQARTVLDASTELDLDRLTRPGLAMLVGQLQQALRQLLDAPPVLYEARWDDQPIARHASREAARAACVTDARRTPDQLGPDAALAWQTDDGTDDLVIWTGAHDTTRPDPTGYSVHPLTTTENTDG
jgi:hypothetical protein